MAVFIDAARQAILEDRYDYEEKQGYLWFSWGTSISDKGALRIDESKRDGLKSIINMRKTQDSLSPGNDQGHSRNSSRNDDEDGERPPRTKNKSREPKIWGGLDIVGKTLEEITEMMESDTCWAHNDGLMKARHSYRVSLGKFRARFPHLPKDVADQLRPFIDVNLYGEPIAMYVYSKYCVRKDSSGWADSHAPTIAKHYECVQLAMFLDGRGVF